MGRRKIEIKAIKDDRNRSVTFLKRKGGLFKKAHELSVLCSVDVAVIIFGHNKKLYQFSSGDIQEILDRHNYYGTPHEHKGPGDYSGRGGYGDDDDDDIDVSPPPDDHGPQDHVMQQHLQATVGMPHHHPLHRQGSHSVSPPLHHVHQGHQKSNSMSNIPGYPPHAQNRLAQPQPSGLSRPSSRNSHQRTASGHGLVHPHTIPMGAQQQQQGQGPQPNGYYMPQYNQQQQQQQQQQGPGPQGQPPQMHVPQNASAPGPQGYPYQGPQGQGPAQQFLHQQQESMVRRSSMPPAIPNQTTAVQQQPPQQSPPLQGPPQQQMPPHEQYGQQHLAQPHEPPMHPQPQEAQPPQEPQPQPQPAPEQVYLDQPKRLSSKHRSIFTPISSDSSLLAQHWAMVNNPTPTSNAVDKENRSHSVDNGTVARANSNEKDDKEIERAGEEPKKRQRPNIPAISTEGTANVPPPSRTSSLISTPGSGLKRPILKVQIPSEHSDGGTPTGGSSPATGTAGPPSGTKSENAHSVVLPPPSPSVNSATNVLSAGGSGPVNPFARPPPTSVKGPPPDQTPLSALPSRFVSGELLPSPSSFFGDWSGGFSAIGKGDDNMLPSPLNFRTPTTSRLYPEEDNAPGKRKSPGSENSEASAAKRVRA